MPDIYHRTPPRKYSGQTWKGLRIGLLGGSFNPPHQGHVHASLVAMKYLDLDAVWWLVSPGNPLKNNSGLPELESRMLHCRQLINDPRLIVSGIEKEFKTRRSLDTVHALKKYFPDTEFIWLAGTDIAFEMHRWHKWKDITRELPLAFIGRPTQSGIVRNTPLRQLPLKHIVPSKGISPKLKPQTVYWLFSDPLNPLSSSWLRSLRTGFAQKLLKR